jgi:DNA-binding NtrC family response regulator
MIKPQLNGLLCLIVEPDNMSAQILAAKLLNGGFSSAHVHTCSTAIDIICKPEEKFDAILVNTTQRSQEVENFPAQIRHASGERAVPPILGYEYVRKQGLIADLVKMGYADCFARPIEPDVLWEKIEAAIDPTLDHKSRVFSAMLSETCLATLETEIVSINEIGVELLSSVGLEVGAIIKLNSPVLVECGVNEVECRVATRNEIEHKHDDKRYRIVAKFISISQKQRQSLRLRTESFARKAKKLDVS